MARGDKGEAEFRALQEALTGEEPCVGYDLYTADETDAAQKALAARLCAQCPARNLCREYAEASKPTVGIWAGLPYPRRGRSN